ncbi:hypothetical protein [Peptostreptococcus faecalis]|uniref:hypothetical protein n=1 Tax=Peptostreptococcus faecalis TaxID=2045015 RepID=UPI001A9A3987|nr:hypothetical protein [Peptostreptococcus faecalis]
MEKLYTIYGKREINVDCCRNQGELMKPILKLKETITTLTEQFIQQFNVRYVAKKP